MPTATSAVLSFRIDERDREIIARAAERRRITISDYVRQHVIEAAEMDLFDLPTARIPAADWEKVAAWVQTPARRIPALEKLSLAKPIWER
jgi:uncharacterized protein (DUF1778 family)